MGARKGQAILFDPDLRRVRALAILERKIKRCMSSKEIGKEFGISAGTVDREIGWAKQQGLVQEYEDQIISGLVPEAIKVFKDALTKGDRQVALEVLKGTGLLRKPTDKASYGTPAPSAEEETLEIHVRKVMRGGISEKQRATRFGYKPLDPNAAVPPANVQEGHLLEAADDAAEASEAPLRAPGDEAGVETADGLVGSAHDGEGPEAEPPATE